MKLIKSENFVKTALQVCLAGKYKKLRMFDLARTVTLYKWTLKELKYFEREADREMKARGLLKDA